MLIILYLFKYAYFKLFIISVVTVAGICNSVGGGVCFDMPPRCRWQWRTLVGVKAKVRWLMGNRWMSLRSVCPTMR